MMVSSPTNSQKNLFFRYFERDHLEHVIDRECIVYELAVPRKFGKGLRVIPQRFKGCKETFVA